MKRAIIVLILSMMVFSVQGVNVSTAFESIDGNYSIVWAYNASDTSDPWKKYVPGAAVGNDLSEISVESGYWVMLNETSNTLSITGTVPSSTNIPLVQGWNLIGYPSTTAQAIGTVLSSLSGSYSIVWAYNASDTSDPWKKYVPGAAVGNDLSTLSSGSGYWVMLNTTSATLTI